MGPLKEGGGGVSQSVGPEQTPVGRPPPVYQRSAEKEEGNRIGVLSYKVANFALLSLSRQIICIEHVNNFKALKQMAIQYQSEIENQSIKAEPSLEATRDDLNAPNAAAGNRLAESPPPPPPRSFERSPPHLNRILPQYCQLLQIGPSRRSIARTVTTTPQVTLPSWKKMPHTGV